jgi:hypothetical protein
VRNDVPTRGRPTLAERSRTSGIGTPPPGPTARPAASSRPPAAPTGSTGERAGATRRGGTPAHCWVLHPGETPDRSPGLLLAWRHDDETGWTALVAFAVPYGPTAATVQAWLPAAQLRPANPA